MFDKETFRSASDAVVAIVVAWTAWHQHKIKADVNKIELSINSRMDTLLKETRESYQARGVLEEQTRAKAEKDSNAEAVRKDQNKP